MQGRQSRETCWACITDCHLGGVACGCPAPTAEGRLCVSVNPGTERQPLEKPDKKADKINKGQKPKIKPPPSTPAPPAPNPPKQG